MSDQNTINQPTDEQSPVSKPVSFLNRRRIVAVVIFVAVALGIIAGVIVSRQPDTSVNVGTQQPRQPTISEQADKINFEGDYDKAQKFLDENIVKSSSPEEQGKLYETKALFALNAKRYGESLGFAHKAEEINSTRNSAVLIAMSAEELGNKQLAIEYYQKVLDRTPEITIEEDKQFYRDKIEALGA